MQLKFYKQVNANPDFAQTLTQFLFERFRKCLEALLSNLSSDESKVKTIPEASYPRRHGAVPKVCVLHSMHHNWVTQVDPYR